MPLRPRDVIPISQRARSFALLVETVPHRFDGRAASCSAGSCEPTLRESRGAGGVWCAGSALHLPSPPFVTARALLPHLDGRVVAVAPVCGYRAHPGAVDPLTVTPYLRRRHSCVTVR